MNKHFRNVLIVLVVSIIITFGFDFFLGGVDGKFETIALNILYGLMIGLSISLSGNITKFILKVSDSENYPVKTYVLLLISVSLYISAVVFLINGLWGKIGFGRDFLDVFTNSGSLIISIITIFIGLIIYFIILSKAYISRILLAEKEILKNQEELSHFQYQVLKNQVNPHFLFNSLNVLSSLIHKDQDKADEFTITLANIYRYILDHQDENLVLIKDEIQFLEKYSYLQSIRFDQNFEIEIQDYQTLQNKWVIPMALQLLIENVFKHNIVSEQNPVKVTIGFEGDYVVVSNNINPKKSREDSHQLGHKNIERRYGILTNKKCEFIKTESNFTVRLPLLEIEK